MSEPAVSVNGPPYDNCRPLAGVVDYLEKRVAEYNDWCKVADQKSRASLVLMGFLFAALGFAYSELKSIPRQPEFRCWTAILITGLIISTLSAIVCGCYALFNLRTAFVMPFVGADAIRAYIKSNPVNEQKFFEDIIGNLLRHIEQARLIVKSKEAALDGLFRLRNLALAIVLLACGGIAVLSLYATLLR